MATPDDQPLFRARGLVKPYQTGAVTVRALHHVDLNIRRGEFIVQLGALGGGNFTLLSLRGGLGARRRPIAAFSPLSSFRGLTLGILLTPNS